MRGPERSGSSPAASFHELSLGHYESHRPGGRANSWRTRPVQFGGSVTVQLHITLGDRARLADTLYQQLLDAIRSGQLREGDPLPPTRQLAAQLRVSRSTVTAAYDRLAGSGYVTARVGSGTFVGTRRPDDVAEAFSSPTTKAVWLKCRAGGIRGRGRTVFHPRSSTSPAASPTPASSPMRPGVGS
jgi:DNA-binding transcriptional regulator YhcF (GntR family)